MSLDDVVVSEAFGALLFALAQAYGATLTAERIKMYALALDGLTIPELRAACVAATREIKCYGNSIPQPAELLAFVRPSADDAGVIAFTALTRAVEDVGPWMSLDLEDAAAGLAVEQVFGGWPEFTEQCEADGGWGAKRLAFLAAYRQARRQGATGAWRLPGLCETGQLGPAARGALAARTWRGVVAANGDVRQARQEPRQLAAPPAVAALPEKGEAG